GEARQRMAVGFDAGAGRDVVADVDHRAPLGEARAQLVVLLQPRAQAVQALGDQFARATRQRLGALVDLDAGNDAGIDHEARERQAVAVGLADGFGVEDRAADVMAEVRRGQQQLAVGAAVGLVAGHADGLETPGDRARRFVDRQDALARCNHRLGGFSERFDAHVGVWAVAGKGAEYSVRPFISRLPRMPRGRRRRQAAGAARLAAEAALQLTETFGAAVLADLQQAHGVGG